MNQYLAVASWPQQMKEKVGSQPWHCIDPDGPKQKGVTGASAESLAYVA